MILWLPFLFVPLVAWFKDATVVVLALGVLLVLAHPDLRRAVLARPRLSPAIMAFGLFAIWTVISFAWAPVFPGVNWIKAFAVLALTVLLARGIDAAPEDLRLRIARGIMGAAAALFALLVIERLTGGFVLGLERDRDSADKHFNTMSAGLAFLSCLTFPAALLLWQRHRRGIVPAAVVLACFALGVTYRMDAAPFGLIVGSIAFLCVWVARRIGYAAVLGLLALVAVCWGALASLAWSDNLPVWLSQHLTPNWGLRVEIWHRVDELIRARPARGYGFDAARVVGQPGAVAIGKARDVNFLHPHNGLLQVWLELGAIGVVLFLSWCAVALRGLQRRATDRFTLAAVLATVLATSVFWEVSFGIWQGWWLAALGLTFVAVRVALRANGFR